METTLMIVWLLCYGFNLWTYSQVVKNMSVEKAALVDWTRFYALAALGPITTVCLLIRFCSLQYKAWQRRCLLKYIVAEIKKELERRGIEVVK